MAALQVPGVDGGTALAYISSIVGGFLAGNLLERKMSKPSIPTEEKPTS